MIQSYDIVIVGGGIVGLMLAARLSLIDELSICIIQDEHPSTAWPEKTFPDRVSALNHTSQSLLESLGIWEKILEEAAPYFKMQVWDRDNGASLLFDKKEIHVSHLGHIVSNRILQKTLWEFVCSHSKIEVALGEKAYELMVNAEGVHLKLKEKNLCAKLLVGADGAASWVHQAAGFERYEYDYDHAALTCYVQTEKSHEYTAFQSFFSEEILAFLPLNDEYHSSIVWSASPQRIQELAELPEAIFKHMLEENLHKKLGSIIKVGKKHIYPLKMRHSKCYVKERIALVGDAIHTLHPLAGQGMNLGLLDADSLSTIIREAHEKKRDIGHLPVLRRYQRDRVGSNWKMIAGVSLIKALFNNPSACWISLRGMGMKQVNAAGPVKKYLMKQALGDRNYSAIREIF